jgi:hypothetical protein
LTFHIIEYVVFFGCYAAAEKAPFFVVGDIGAVVFFFWGCGAGFEVFFIFEVCGAAVGFRVAV